jgi:murein L,D-transpeptidase YcbB/YkuD
VALCLALIGSLGTEAAAQSPAAAHLQTILDRYRAIEAGGGWPTVPDGPALRVGSSGPAVVRLRERLAATGDLAADDTRSDDFDGALAMAVETFQARHGLDVDGVVGPKTRAALNVSAAARVRQIATNMERLQSLPAMDGERTILINVAAFDLTVLENGHTVFASPVIVGRLSRPTPVLSSAVTRVVVNPYWNIPRRIAVTDILPKIRKDPSYLTAQSIRVYRAGDSARIEVPGDSVPWGSLNRNNFPYILVQDPGPANALGRVKFFLPNDHEIFLHDTPAQELFNHGKRTFSSGCIRVGKALELAEFLLRRDGLSSFREMADALQRRETRQISLKEPVPLYIVYLTAWPDRNGQAQFRDDVYALDDQIAARRLQDAAKRNVKTASYEKATVPACSLAPGQLPLPG